MVVHVVSRESRAVSDECWCLPVASHTPAPVRVSLTWPHLPHFRGGFTPTARWPTDPGFRHSPAGSLHTEQQPPLAFLLLDGMPPITGRNVMATGREQALTIATKALGVVPTGTGAPLTKTTSEPGCTLARAASPIVDSTRMPPTVAAISSPRGPGPKATVLRLLSVTKPAARSSKSTWPSEALDPLLPVLKALAAATDALRGGICRGGGGGSARRGAALEAR